MQERQCLNCGRTFTVRKPSETHRYCSIGCGVSATRKGVSKPHLWKFPPIPCERCGKVFKPTSHRSRFCNKKCSNKTTAEGRENTRGWTRSSTGYILIYRPQHLDASRTGYVLQHRLMMEEHLGRRLRRGEVVHHRNGIRDDNRLENLEILTKKQHDRMPKGRKRRIIECPCCGRKLRLSNSVRTVEPISD